MTAENPLSDDPARVPAGMTTPSPGVATVACCPVADAASQKPCGLCQSPVCKGCRTMVNARYVCRQCRDQILHELEAERAGVVRLPPAILAGVAASVVGGAVWALIGILTNLAIGYVAVGVGWLAGTAVVIGAGRKKGQVLQIVAVA